MLQFITDYFVNVVAFVVDLFGELLVAEVREGLSRVELAIALQLQLSGGNWVGASIVSHLLKQIAAFVAI